MQYLLLSRSSLEKHRELTIDCHSSGVPVRITADEAGLMTDTSGFPAGCGGGLPDDRPTMADALAPVRHSSSVAFEYATRATPAR